MAEEEGTGEEGYRDIIVADTSALVSLGVMEVAEVVVEGFPVHITDVVLNELEDTADHNDPAGRGSSRVLELKGQLNVHSLGEEDFAQFVTGKVDRGEASVLALAQITGAGYLLTDDFKGIGTLFPLARTMGTEPIVSVQLLRFLVRKELLSEQKAKDKAKRLANARDWKTNAIYRNIDMFFPKG